MAKMSFRPMLFVLALLGIVIGPMSIGYARSIMLATENGSAAKMRMMDMSSDMPCCPDDMPIKPGSGSNSCPLALVCTTVIVANPAFGSISSFSPRMQGSALLAASDAELASSLVSPPARPPKIRS
jgi:hypothetical protein